MRMEESLALNQEEVKTGTGRPKLWWCEELEEEVVLVGCRKCRINAQ
jgi:hypothetical protein